jgi:hypothetical protein
MDLGCCGLYFVLFKKCDGGGKVALEEGQRYNFINQDASQF